jgi:2OG-Fe(II) oxygenase superfamily
MAAAAAAAAAYSRRRRRTVWSIGVCGWWWIAVTTTTTWPIMANAASSAWSLLSLLLLTHGSNNNNPSCRFGHIICRRSRMMRIFPAANRHHHQPPQQQPDAAPTTTQRHLETNTAVDNIPLLMSSSCEDDIPLCGGDVKEQSPLELLRLLACGERSLVHLPAPPPLSTFSNGDATNNKNSACRNAASYWRNEWEYDDDNDDDDGLFSFLETMVLQQCRCDALALQAAGFGARAGVVRDTSIVSEVSAATATDTASSLVRPIRSRVHQIWLQTPTTLDNSNSPISQLGTMVGYMDARRALLQWLDRLRRSLNEARRRSGSSCTDNYDIPVDNWLPHHLVEASYVVYDANGAYYDKHWDVPTTQQRGDSTGPGRRRRRQRAISVILYLGPFGLADQDDDDDEPPWSVADGGELRIHGAQHVRWLLQQDGDTSVRNAAATTTDSCGHGTASNDDEDLVVVQDLAPRPGTLVLFDSASVPHEVRPTAQRGRVALVAWFGTLS